MNALVSHFSKFVNTKMVAEAIAETLGSKGDVQVINADVFTTAYIKREDLVVMGSPTHKMNLPMEVRAVFDRLPKRILKRKFITAFDTSYKMSWWLNRFTAGKRLVKRLRMLGGKCSVPPQTFHVIKRGGPLYDGEIDRAVAWAEAILEQAK
jgi:flavodoxin